MVLGPDNHKPKGNIMKTSKYITDFATVANMTARTRPLALADDGTAYPWLGVEDSIGNILPPVSPRYALVPNRTLVDVTADALFDCGVERGELRRGRAMYHNGRSRLNIDLLGEQFTVPGDPSDLIPQLAIGNAFAGLGSIQFRIELVRLICTNGMVQVIRQHVVKMRHVGVVEYEDLYPKVRKIVAKMLKEVADQKEVASLLASVPAPESYITRLLEETAERYQSRLAAAIDRNMADLGATAWGLAQGITEHATHERPVSWASQDWSANAIADLVKVVRQ